MDNYLSMVSGQAPEEGTQEDCSVSNKLIGPNSDILDIVAKWDYVVEND